MAVGVTEQAVGGVTVITLEASGSGGMTSAIRSELSAALDRVEAEGRARAIVIAARGRGFPATPPDDGEELPEEYRDPDAGALFLRIENLSVPVFAAMHGTVTGLGLELGLAAHYRIADRRTRFRMQGLAAGLLPSAGGLQRLCRAIGPEEALTLILSGREIEAAGALELGLVSAIADAPLPKFTLGFVRDTLAGGGGPRPLGRQDARLTPRRELLDKLAERRKVIARSPDSPVARALDCVEAALLLPYQAALAAERAAAEDLRASEQSRALRHVGRAEAAARQPPVAADIAPRPLDRIGVAGGGPIGRGVVAASLSAGFPVTLVERDMERLEASVEGIIDIFDRELARGRIDADTRDARMARLTGTVDLASLANADLVIEAVDEDADTKRRVIGALDTAMKRGAILATTTGSLDIDGLAASTSRPEDILGLNVFLPVQLIRGMEVVVAMDSSDAAIATAWEFASRLGKIATPAAVAEGYVIRKVLAALRDAAALAVLEGASVAEVDESLRAYGFPLGPFEAWDLEGLTVAWDPVQDPSGLRKALSAEGRTGRAGGRGWYRYVRGEARGQPDPAVEDVVARIRAGAGVAATGLTPEAIERRCLSAMVNAGVLLLAEGVANRPEDIDLGAIHAAGYPRDRGGPMMAADLTGLLRIKRDLDRLAASAPGGAFWQPAPLLGALVKNGLSFADLNRDPDRIQDL